MEPKWLEWAKSLQAEAQNGLTFARNEFEVERYRHIMEIAMQMMASNSGTDMEFVKDLFRDVEGYATPRVDVRGVIFKDDRILLVKEKSDGGWTLPGGWADPNETPSQSVEREVFEESGFEAKAVKMLAVLDRVKQGHVPPSPYHIYKLFFLCKIVGGAKATSIETEAVDFFHEDNIPPLSTSRTTAKQISRFFEHKRKPDLPTDFD